MVLGIPFTAAATFFVTGLGVYLQGTGGGIRESTVHLDTDQWTGGTTSDVRVVAKLQSPVAVMQTTDVSSRSH
jgi:hypothetical protein